jgi:hypothetical protein
MIFSILRMKASNSVATPKLPIISEKLIAEVIQPKLNKKVSLGTGRPYDC